MGNISFQKRNNMSDELLPIEYKEIFIGNNSSDNSGQKVVFLVGDYPTAYLKEDTECIPDGIDESEFNNTLADAYICGII